MREVKEAAIECLSVGDLIYLEWYDASGWDRKRLPKRKVETLIYRVGWFLGLKGRVLAHIIIAHEKVPEPRVFSFDVIPTNLVKRVIIVCPKFMQTYMPHVLKELKRQTKRIPRRLLNASNPHSWEVQIC